MNKHQFEGAWHELKGKAQKQWGKLTNDELDKIEGKYEELCGSLQRKYGYTKEKAEQEVDNFLDAQNEKQ